MNGDYSFFAVIPLKVPLFFSCLNLAKLAWPLNLNFCLLFFIFFIKSYRTASLVRETIEYNTLHTCSWALCTRTVVLGYWKLQYTTYNGAVKVPETAARSLKAICRQ